MRIILLLCATLALTIAAVVPVEEVAAAEEVPQVVPVEEVAAAEEVHQDGELPVETEVEEVKLVVDGKKSSCPNNWSKYESRCFMFVNREVSWVDAESYCLRYGTNLASIHNNGEYDFIREVVKSGTSRYPETWLGGNDAVKDSTWLWSDGSSFNFRGWSFGEPNNNGGNERCVVMNYSDDFLMGDVRCELRRSFVCGTRPL
ncbi:galactose-specific lectin nattectin-like [Pagrus major]|uniref:galactose-specific lectin nattectin-like n=1 Tax=Pagrus major TaxID=143350 RepID=UPI003CC8C7FC